MSKIENEVDEVVGDAALLHSGGSVMGKIHGRSLIEGG